MNDASTRIGDDGPNKFFDERFDDSRPFDDSPPSNDGSEGIDLGFQDNIVV